MGRLPHRDSGFALVMVKTGPKMSSWKRVLVAGTSVKIVVGTQQALASAPVHWQAGAL